MSLKLIGIDKSFGSNRVLKNVSLELGPGSVHALIGENGAGKSTLMNILGGILRPDGGHIELDGKTVHFNKPSDSLESGIAFIHQELNLINDLTIYENFFIGKELRRRSSPFLDKGEMISRSIAVLKRMNINLDPTTPVGDLDRACSIQTKAETAQSDADKVVSSDHMTLSHRFALLIGSSPIGFVFVAVLLIAIGFVIGFSFTEFMKLWKKYSLFSTLMAFILMVVVQVYAPGFKFASYGEWAGYWLKNFLNVLRSNSSVGMIALGMTFVIITGGIDLAVGSNLAGVATVVMVLLDTSSRGVLTGVGVTGVPNFIIAICAGLLTRAVIGVLTGLGITRGKVPPFIIILGIMNIVRSVAQYFTKSYKPEVPKAFQVIANTEVIGGQMLLPIIYWIILAVIMYVISKHTAFGKHIYAVGSNERASRLSGINVDSVKMKVYILMGIIVAIASITSVARLRGVDVASAGTGFEMNAIAAVVVGGTSMAGGRGSILGTVLGVLIIGIMNNLLVLLGIDAFLADAFTGAIIIIAVLILKERNADENLFCTNGRHYG